MTKLIKNSLNLNFLKGNTSKSKEKAGKILNFESEDHLQTVLKADE